MNEDALRALIMFNPFLHAAYQLGLSDGDAPYEEGYDDGYDAGFVDGECDE